MSRLIFVLIFFKTFFFSFHQKIRPSKLKTLIYASVPKFDAMEEIGFQENPFKSGFITIIGNPNVGKSTLMNALLKEKLSIVSPKPQTTRHRILGVVTEKEYQMIFSDTPGMLAPAYKLQNAMMDTVKGATNDADVILLLTDVFGEELADENILTKLQLTDRPVVVVINKMDLISDLTTGRATKLPSKFAFEGRNTTPLKQRLLEKKLAAAAAAAASSTGSDTTAAVESGDGLDAQFKLFEQQESGAKASAVKDSSSNNDKSGTSQQQAEAPGSTGKFGRNRVELAAKPKTLEELKKQWTAALPKAQLVSVSAQNDTGINILLETILSHMNEGPKYFPEDQITNRDERFFTAEIIREAILGQYKDEIPYSCEVLIEGFTDKSERLTVIEANIVVSRSSHKSILIGKGGAALKELGTAARIRLEAFLDRKVFLQLRVKLDDDWRNKDDSLRKYGYIDSDFG